MPKRPLESLGAMVRGRRGHKRLREAAREIGISAATLMRVESGRIPDVDTFGKICTWLKVDPKPFLGMAESVTPGSPTPHTASVLSISAHFRADQTPKPETVQALAQMVLLAMKFQPRIPDK